MQIPREYFMQDRLTLLQKEYERTHDERYLIEIQKQQQDIARHNADVQRREEQRRRVSQDRIDRSIPAGKIIYEEIPITLKRLEELLNQYNPNVQGFEIIARQIRECSQSFIHWIKLLDWHGVYGKEKEDALKKYATIMVKTDNIVRSLPKTLDGVLDPNYKKKYIEQIEQMLSIQKESLMQINQDNGNIKYQTTKSDSVLMHKTKINYFENLLQQQKKVEYNLAFNLVLDIENDRKQLLQQHDESLSNTISLKTKQLYSFKNILDEKSWNKILGHYGYILAESSGLNVGILDNYRKTSYEQSMDEVYVLPPSEEVIENRNKVANYMTQKLEELYNAQRNGASPDEITVISGQIAFCFNHLKGHTFSDEKGVHDVASAVLKNFRKSKNINEKGENLEEQQHRK